MNTATQELLTRLAEAGYDARMFGVEVTDKLGLGGAVVPGLDEIAVELQEEAARRGKTFTELVNEFVGEFRARRPI